MPDQYDAFRQSMIQKHPNIDRKQLSELDDFLNQKRAAGLVSSGKLTLEQAANPKIVSLASQIAASGGNIPSDPSQSSDANSVVGAENTIGELKNLYDTSVKSPFGIKGKVATAFGGKVGLNPATWLNIIPSLTELGLFPDIATYERLREGATPTIAYGIQGQKGQLNQAEFESARNLIPSASDNPSYGNQLFESMANKINLQKQLQGVNPVNAANQQINSDPLGILQ